MSQQLITTSTKLDLPSKENQLHLEVKDNLDLKLSTLPKSEGTLIIFVTGTGNLNLQINFPDDTFWSYLWVNESPEKLTISEDIYVGANSKILANYGEFSDGSHQKETKIYLNGADSDFTLKGATIASSKLSWIIQSLHHAKRTNSNLSNYAIALEGSEFSLDVAGHIYNGHKGSETHQISRVLNLSKKINSVVYPKLLIEENDVAASHAASVGQPNPDHIYYLQSRGLKKEEALGLITLGYLIPIVSEIENDTVKQQLIDLINQKINENVLGG